MLFRIAAALVMSAVVAAQTANDADRLLRGAIDVHVHSDPDNVPRSLDGIEAAKQARSKAMRAIVLKNHYEPTAGLSHPPPPEAASPRRFIANDPETNLAGLNTSPRPHPPHVG